MMTLVGKRRGREKKKERETYSTRMRILFIVLFRDEKKNTSLCERVKGDTGELANAKWLVLVEVKTNKVCLGKRVNWLENNHTGLKLKSWVSFLTFCVWRGETAVHCKSCLELVRNESVLSLGYFSTISC